MMIRFSLKCSQGHEFESWFASGTAFDTLQSAGHLSCPDCGDGQIEKAIMAPNVRSARRPDTRRDAPAQPEQDQPGTDPVQTQDPRSAVQARIAALRRHVEQNSHDVGANFAAEARRMHAGESDKTAIHGDARLDEARALLEDGIPVAPLPWLSRRRTN